MVLKAILEPVKNLLVSELTLDGQSISSFNKLNKFYKNEEDIESKNNRLIENGIIDSLKSLVIGLQTSSSLTQMLLTIDHIITT